MDINLFRVEKGGKPEVVKDSQKKRGKPESDVDEVIRLDEEWRKITFEFNQASKKIKSNQTLMNEKRKAGEDTAPLIKENEELKKTVAELKKAVSEKEKERDEKLYSIGNLVHESVPISMDEKDNIVVKTHGENKPQTPELKHHHQLLHMIDGYESDAGVAVAGHRGFYLKGWGLILNQALINYGLSYLAGKGYLPIQPPFFMKKSIMGKVAALAEFDEQLYKVETEKPDEESVDPCYLIATSEQPCCALHHEQTINPKELPIKYVGYSTCFRKEAGSHGKDVWGIFRVHQFEKIEQFVLCSPDKSWEMHEEMTKVSEEFYQSLGFSYRVVNIVSGELNNAASKKYDLEAWFPTLACYRELVSASNCTDYQARRLDIKYGQQKNEDGSRTFVHMLNSTLCATERTLCCLLENYQTEKGIQIPKALQPFVAPYVKSLEDPELIPFKKPCPPLGNQKEAAKPKEQKKEQQKQKQ